MKLFYDLCDTANSMHYFTSEDHYKPMYTADMSGAYFKETIGQQRAYYATIGDIRVRIGSINTFLRERSSQ